MWCNRCKKEVDINSVAVNKPQAAFSMDVEGDVTPTMIRSTSNIINICKSCGESDYLFDSEASARREGERQKAQQKKDAKNERMKEEIWYRGFLMSLVLGLVSGLIACIVEVWPSRFASFYLIGLAGTIVGLFATWVVADLKSGK